MNKLYEFVLRGIKVCCEVKGGHFESPKFYAIINNQRSYLNSGQYLRARVERGLGEHLPWVHVK